MAELKRRLRKTRNWAVVLKSLILIHRLLREGYFILQDQLSIDTFTSGHSYLNLTGFKDTWLCTCRVLGKFLDGRSGYRSTSSMVNTELLRELSALGELLAVTCKCV